MAKNHRSSKPEGYIKKKLFVDTAVLAANDIEAMQTIFTDKGHQLEQRAIEVRLHRYIAKGLVPLSSGNTVSKGEILKGTSTLYGDDGSVKMQWVKSDVAKESQLEAVKEAIKGIVESIDPIDELPKVTTSSNTDLATLYISNDVHLGLLTHSTETGTDWNLEKGTELLKSSYDYLFTTSPDSSIGIVVDLGDFTEADGYRNSTAKSGNPLDVSARFPVVLRAAYESLIYAINLALLKHETVYFYNVEGK